MSKKKHKKSKRYGALGLVPGQETCLHLYDSSTGELYVAGPGVEFHVYLTEDAALELAEHLNDMLDAGLFPADREELPEGALVNIDDETYDG